MKLIIEIDEKLYQDSIKLVEYGYTLPNIVPIAKGIPYEERPQGEWISVSEKLPSDYNEDWVLAQIQEDNGYLWMPCVAEYRKSKDDWYSYTNNLCWVKEHNGAFKVIAWMPLPEAYKEAENGVE